MELPDRTSVLTVFKLIHVIFHSRSNGQLCFLARTCYNVTAVKVVVLQMPDTEWSCLAKLSSASRPATSRAATASSLSGFMLFSMIVLHLGLQSYSSLTICQDQNQRNPYPRENDWYIPHKTKSIKNGESVGVEKIMHGNFLKTSQTVTLCSGLLGFRRDISQMDCRRLEG